MVSRSIYMPTRGPTGRVWGKFQEQRPLIIGLVVLAVLWEFSTLFLPPIITPPLKEIAVAMWSIISQYDQLIHLFVTALRVLVAVVVSFVLGAALGIAMGSIDSVREYAKPMLHFIQGIPALSWVIFAVIWFSTVELRIGFILLIVTMPSFALYIDGAVRGINLDLIHLGQAFRTNRMQQYRMIIIPAIIPEVISSWVVNLGTAVRIAMVAELIGSNIGVGFQLLQAQAVFDMAGAIAWTLCLVVLLSLFQATITFLEGRLLGWRPKGEQP